MQPHPLNEAETRMALIDPVLIAKGWDIQQGTLRLEKTLGANGFNEHGKPCKLSGGRVDYLLQLKLQPHLQALAIAFIEAKPQNSPVTEGLEQAINYARFHHVGFVYATNGDLYIEHDCKQGITHAPRPLREFPSHEQLTARYLEANANTAQHSNVLTTRYDAKEAKNIRYYQDAAIRAVLEKIIACEQANQPKRALLSLATGTGKTRLATNLLKRISDAGLLDKALFVCDRDELRSQGHEALSLLFGSNVQMVTGNNPQKNAKVLVATYQTLGVADEQQSDFLQRNYPENYFSHIIIDECHRSGFGKWSTVLSRNANAVHIGLTATPRQLSNSEDSEDDNKISADNHIYFGEPVYEYDLVQAVKDGYLSVCQIIPKHVLIEGINETQGLEKTQLSNASLHNYHTGARLSYDELKTRYSAVDIDKQIIAPERTQQLCASLFNELVGNNTPEQKTIIFCAGVPHAQRVTIELNNLYAQWCKQQGRDRLDAYAFECTGNAGSEYIKDLRLSHRSHFIACTADLLQAGIDIPRVQNIVFFAHINSAIRFYQMVGRGTRLNPETNKTSFTIYDYTNATRLFGEEFVTKATAPSQTKPPKNDTDNPPPPPIILQATGLNIDIANLAPQFLMPLNGKHQRVDFETYQAHLKAVLREQMPKPADFVQQWINNPAQLLDNPQVQTVLQYKQPDYDSFDALIALGYDLTPQTKQQRVNQFLANNQAWFVDMQPQPANTLQALAQVFKTSGTEGLINKELFNMPQLKQASGGNPANALRLIGNPAQVFIDFKNRLFFL